MQSHIDAVGLPVLLRATEALLSTTEALLSKKRNTIPRCGFEHSMPGMQLDALTTDLHLIQTGKFRAA